MMTLKFASNSGHLFVDDEVSSLLISTALSACASLLLLAFIAVLFRRSDIKTRSGIFTLIVTVIASGTFVLVVSALNLQPISDQPDSPVQTIEIVDPNSDKLITPEQSQLNRRAPL